MIEFCKVWVFNCFLGRYVGDFLSSWIVLEFIIYLFGSLGDTFCFKISTLDLTFGFLWCFVVLFLQFLFWGC